MAEDPLPYGLRREAGLPLGSTDRALGTHARTGQAERARQLGGQKKMASNQRCHGVKKHEGQEDGRSLRLYFTAPSYCPVSQIQVLFGFVFVLL